MFSRAELLVPNVKLFLSTDLKAGFSMNGTIRLRIGALGLVEGAFLPCAWKGGRSRTLYL